MGWRSTGLGWFFAVQPNQNGTGPLFRAGQGRVVTGTEEEFHTEIEDGQVVVRTEDRDVWLAVGEERRARSCRGHKDRQLTHILN